MSTRLADEGHDVQPLLSLYRDTRAEITRYRDLEWKHFVVFSGAVYGLIALLLGKVGVAEAFSCLLYIAFPLLAFAGVYFIVYAHCRLATFRALAKTMEYLLGFDQGIQYHPDPTSGAPAPTPVARARVLPKKYTVSATNCPCEEFPHGLFDHVIPFCIILIALAVLGFCIVCRIV